MKIDKKKVLPAAIVASLIVGVSFASGKTGILHSFGFASPPPPAAAPLSASAHPSPPGLTQTPDLTHKEETLRRIARLKEEIADERQDLKQDQSLLRDHRREEKNAIKDRVARLRAEIADEQQDLRQIQDQLRREEKSSAEALRDRIRRLDTNLSDARQDLSKDKALLPTLGEAAKKETKEKMALLNKKIDDLRQHLGALRDRLKGDRLAFKDRVEDHIARLKEEITDERQDLKESLDRLKAKRMEARDRILDRIIRLRESIADQRQDLLEERKDLGSSLRNDDHPDREASEAAFHHDGDDHGKSLDRPSGLASDPHREAISEIREASRLRVARLYSPEHHAGYHARMHRHTR